MIKEITDKKIWNDFVTAQPEHSFLQSWNWGEFNAAMGDGIQRLGLYDGDTLIAVALVLTVRARRGSFYFLPHGPCTALGARQASASAEGARLRPEVLSEFIEYLKQKAKQEGIAFIRISPQMDDTPELRSALKQLKLRPAPMHMNAERSWVLDITKPEDQLLADMRKANRYNINRAIKECVTVTHETELGEFYELFQQFANKKHFVPFSKAFITKEFETFSSDKQVVLLKTMFEDDILAMGMFIFYGTTAYYHQSFTTDKHPKKQGSYLMLWEAIREAKKRGCTQFNFWGIADRDNKKHPWAGLTFFKTGFGGHERNYIHAHDLPLTSKYWLNFIIETIRRKKRGF